MIQKNGKPRFPPRAVAGDIGQFAHDVVTLAELQVELLKVETDDYARRMARPLVAVMTSVILVLGCVPVGLIGLAYRLAEAGIDLPTAFLLAAGIGGVAAVLIALFSWRAFRRVSHAFERSRCEIRNNIDWIKGVLRRKPTHSLHTPGN